MHKEPQGEEDRKEPGKVPFWRKQKKNAAEYGVKFRGLRVRESDVNASKMSFFPKGTKGHAATTLCYR